MKSTESATYSSLQKPSLAHSNMISKFETQKQRAVVTEELSIFLYQDLPSRLPLNCNLTDMGIPRNVLISIACLSSPFQNPSSRDSAIDTLALYLISESALCIHKIECIRLLILSFSQSEYDWKVQKGCLKETLSFLLNRMHDWAFPHHSEMLLLLELRAKCLYFKERHLQKCNIDIDFVIKGSGIAAKSIANTAKSIKIGINSSASLLHVYLDHAGQTMKCTLTPNEIKDAWRAQKLAHITSTTKLMTLEARKNANCASTFFRDVAMEVIGRTLYTLEDRQVCEKLIPNKKHRDLLAAGSELCISMIGGIVIVSDALLESTKLVNRKIVSVTVEVVRHKYGDSCGQIFKDGCDATGNVLSIISDIALLDKGIGTKSLAKTSSRRHFRDKYDCDENRCEVYDPMVILDPTKVEAHRIVARLKRSPRMASKDMARIARV
jgi:Senescence-associated protein